MSSLTKFYINTSQFDDVIKNLQQLVNSSTAKKGDTYLESLSTEPDFATVGLTQPEWIAVEHMTSNKLESWATELSKQFNCKFIVIMGESVSDYYYFALYDSGNKLREVEICYNHDIDNIDFGEKFPFEGDKPGRVVNFDDGDGDRFLFDLEAMDNYCLQFGLQMRADIEEAEDWTNVKKSQNGRR